MRRYIAYITLSCAMILGVGLATAPVIENLNPDVAYADGRTMYFKASHYDAESQIGNYDDFLTSEDVSGDDYVIELIADTMRDRLDNWGLSEYTVATEGYDTVKVTLRTTSDSESQYTALEEYLAFSGGDISIDASNVSLEDYASSDLWATMFDGQTAWIDYIEQGAYSVPVVIVPIEDDQDNYDAFLNLIEYCNDNTTEEVTDDEGNVTQEAQSVNLVVWANRNAETDVYTDAATNQNVAAKVVGVFGTSNDNCVWYDDNDDDQEYPSMQLVPSSEATSSGSYDPTYSQEAYEAAVLLCNKINASSYISDYSSGSYWVTYTHSEDVSASVEQLINYGYWYLSPALSRTLACVIAVAVIFMVLMLAFERSNAWAIIACTFLSTFASFAVFVALGVQFNIAALIGLGVAMLLGAFGGIYYSKTLKDELYKGRTLKKAHSEAAKRSLWPTLDAGIVSIIIGIFVYVLAGDLASKLGTMLVLGGVFSMLANLIVLRFMGWLFANDSESQERYPKLLGVDKDKVPDPIKEEKQTYFGPTEGKDFNTKPKKLSVGILSGVLLVAGIVTLSVFGALNDGNVYNDAAYRQEETVLSIEVKSTSAESISGEASALSSIEDLYDPEVASPSGVFYKIQFGTSTDNLRTMASIVEDVELSESTLTILDESVGTDGTSYYIYYFTVTFSEVLDVESDEYVAIVDGVSYTDAAYTLNEIVGFGIQNLGVSSSIINSEGDGVLDWIVVSFKSSTPEEATPYLWRVSLGVGVGAAVVMVYLMIRYRLSRGFALTMSGAIASFIGITFFVTFRISVHPVVSLGAAAAIVVAYLLGIFMLSKEKEIFRDSREKDKNNLAFRSECLKTANSRSAATIFEFALLAAYIGLVFLGVGPTAYAAVYLCFLISLLFATGIVITVLNPFSVGTAKLLGKIKINKPRRKKKAKVGQLGKKNSSEPEEAIFIGIND